MGRIYRRRPSLVVLYKASEDSIKTIRVLVVLARGPNKADIEIHKVVRVLV